MNNCTNTSCTSEQVGRAFGVAPTCIPCWNGLLGLLEYSTLAAGKPGPLAQNRQFSEGCEKILAGLRG